MNFTVEKGQSRAFFHKGEMLEWLKRHAWKACKLQKGFRGSNPRLSATKDCKKIFFFKSTLVHVHSAGRRFLRARYPR